jgi:hypothetical protein
MMALLEDKQSLGREDLSCPYFWIPLFCSRRDFRGLSMEKNEYKGGYLMSLSYEMLCI